MKSSGRQRRSRKYEEDVRERRLTPGRSSLLSREGNVRQFYRRAFCILHAHLVWRVSGTNRRYRENRQPDNFSALNVSIGSSLAARNAGTREWVAEHNEAFCIPADFRVLRSFDGRSQ